MRMYTRKRELPARFEVLAEALAAGREIEEACRVVGGELAGVGADLAETLGELRTTYAKVVGREPDFVAVRALVLAWSEETLGYLHQLSCEDPLTGLASLAHLRARLSEIYRGAEERDGSATTSHALVVVDLPPEPVGEHFSHVLRVVRLAETLRLVFSGDETIARIAPHRLTVMAARDGVLDTKVASLRALIDVVDPQGTAVRVWVEGLPSTDASAGVALAELAHT